MQNRLPSSTENSYREEETDFRVFLKACDEPASQLNPDRDKILILQKIIFSSKFRSAAARLDFSHLGTLLNLQNLRKCIIQKLLALILTASFQIGIKFLIFQKIIFCKFRGAAARMDFSHLGTLLKLRNLRKCIIQKFLASIHTVILVLTETQNVPLIMRKLPVWCGTRSWQYWRWYAAPPATAVQHLDGSSGGTGERWRAVLSQFEYLAEKV